jgi:hypothetical protein
MFRKLYDWLHRFSKKPWAAFEVTDMTNDQIKVQFAWNPAMIDVLAKMGYTGMTEEDMVQSFFYISQMKPESLDEPHESIAPVEPMDETGVTVFR